MSESASADKLGLTPEQLFVTSVMPCTAKKFEAQRPEMNDSGYQDVDYVLTTREAARLIKVAGLDLAVGRTRRRGGRSGPGGRSGRS